MNLTRAFTNLEVSEDICSSLYRCDTFDVIMTSSYLSRRSSECSIIDGQRQRVHPLVPMTLHSRSLLLTCTVSFSFSFDCCCLVSLVSYAKHQLTLLIFLRCPSFMSTHGRIKSMMDEHSFITSMTHKVKFL